MTKHFDPHRIFARKACLGARSTSSCLECQSMPSCLHLRLSLAPKEVRDEAASMAGVSSIPLSPSGGYNPTSLDAVCKSLGWKYLK